MKKRIVLALVALALVAVGVSAQDWSLEPAYGTMRLNAGFPNDPRTINLTAGGAIDIGGLGYYGYVANAPDLDLYYEAGGFPLTIKVDNAAGDTLLLINTPDGQWHFNDDYNGLDPQITFRNPQSGLYNIWVGTVWDELVPARLVITEF